jgi:glutamate synthase (NADPH/NADH) large chain
VAVILGRIGANFGAGMTGGMAYVWDPEGRARGLMNMDSLVVGSVAVPHWEEQLRTLVERHEAETGSRRAAELLSDWATARAQFLQVCPREMLVHLKHPLAFEELALPAE